MSRKSTVLAVAIAVVAGATTAYAGSGSGLPLGPVAKRKLPTYRAYYDGHKDTYLVTDVSNKKQATAMHINYSAELGAVKRLPAQYFVRGRAKTGQLSIFGSEPGETNYNPLWEEFFVAWKAGVKPVLLVKDDQIKSLVKRKKLTLRDAHIVLNAPIIKVGK